MLRAVDTAEFFGANPEATGGATLLLAYQSRGTPDPRLFNCVADWLLERAARDARVATVASTQQHRQE